MLLSFAPVFRNKNKLAKCVKIFKIIQRETKSKKNGLTKVFKSLDSYFILSTWTWGLIYMNDFYWSVFSEPSSITNVTGVP